MVVYRIGQKVKVKITKADPETREIDFELVPDPNAPKYDGPKRSTKGRGRGNSQTRGKDSGSKEKFSSYKPKGKESSKKKSKPFYKEVAKKKKPKKK